MVDADSWAPLPARTVAAVAADLALARLLAWAAAGGAVFDAIDIRVDARGNRSVHARRDLAAGDAVVVVPRHLMITDVDVGAHAVVAAVAGFQGMLRSAHSTMATWLALAARDPASPWRPYLDALPPAFPWLPAFRRADQVAALTATWALTIVVDQVAGFRGDHALIRQLVPDLGDLELAEFAWGRAVAMSRCFRVAVADGSVRALVPVADMFDHGRADATWSYDDATGAFAIHALRALTAGQEIQLSYGGYDNALFVSAHGFAIADNRDDEAVLAIATADGTAVVEVGTWYGPHFERALAAARAWPDPGDDDAIVTRVAAAAAAASAALVLAPAPPDDDPGWARICAIVRAGERAVLAAVVEFCTRFGAITDRSPAAWRALAASLDPEVTGAERLLRSYALAAGGDGP